MDEIQKILIKAGRKDLAQKYFHKICGGREVDIKDISNFKKLPKNVKKLIESADTISSYGFQELAGHIGRQAIFSALVSWEGNKVTIENIGGKLNGKQVQWKD